MISTSKNDEIKLMVCNKIVTWKSKHHDATAWLVIDKLINNACGGGTFMHENATLAEVQELAANMTLKNQLNEIPFGGAKAGICFDPKHPESEAVLFEFLQYCLPYLRDCWATGADLNTSAAFIEETVQSFGLDSAFYALGKMYAKELSIKNQSRHLVSRVRLSLNQYFNLEQSAVGYSLTELVRRLSQQRLRVIVQGFGKIGSSLTYYLQQCGIADVIVIADATGYMACEHGIDVEQLLQLRAKYGNTTPLSDLQANYKSDEETTWCPVTPETHATHFRDLLQTYKANCVALCANRYAIDEDLLQIIQQNTFNKNDVSYILSGANLPFTTTKLRDSAVDNGIVVFPSWLTSAGNSLLYAQALSEESITPGWPEKTMQKISSLLIQHGVKFYEENFLLPNKRIA